MAKLSEMENAPGRGTVGMAPGGKALLRMTYVCSERSLVGWERRDGEEEVSCGVRQAQVRGSGFILR